MEIGLQIPHTGAPATPQFVREWCSLADQAGFASLWGVDHLVMPQHTDSLYTLARRPAAIGDDGVSSLLAPNFELMTTLAYVAAVTDRIKIGTSVAVLSIRNAILNARQLATVDRYSGGRLIYGVGVGWVKEEADALNMPWDRRGARSEEHIALLRALWTEPGAHVEFHGEFWDVPPMDPEPRPVQRPIPILIGGHSEVAIDRAARIGDGWIAASMSPERLADHMGLLRAAAARHDRDPATMFVHCAMSRGTPATLEQMQRYADIGVQSLSLDIDSIDELKRFADEVLPKVS